MTTRWILDLSSLNEAHGCVRYEPEEILPRFLQKYVFFDKTSRGVTSNLSRNGLIINAAFLSRARLSELEPALQSWRAPLVALHEDRHQFGDEKAPVLRWVQA